MIIIFFHIKGIAPKEFVLAGQTVNSAYYRDVLRRLRENMHHDNAPYHTSFFTREFFTKNNVTVVPHPPYVSVSPIEDKTERQTF
jgi:hypothetical protein